MGKLLVLIREFEKADKDAYTYFVIDDDIKETEIRNVFKKAIREFLLSEKYKEYESLYDDDYNWSDTLLTLTKDCWKKHGIQLINKNEEYRITSEVVELRVENDENLLLSLK